MGACTAKLGLSGLFRNSRIVMTEQLGTAPYRMRNGHDLRPLVQHASRRARKRSDRQTVSLFEAHLRENFARASISATTLYDGSTKPLIRIVVVKMSASETK